jgi:hypothetical protein
VGVEMYEPWQRRGFSSRTRATAAAVEFACPCTTVPLQTDSDFGASTANRSLVPDVRSGLAAHYFSHHRPSPLAQHRAHPCAGATSSSGLSRSKTAKRSPDSEQRSERCLRVHCLSCANGLAAAGVIVHCHRQEHHSSSLPVP